MFNASIDIELGDGCLTLFWSDHWLGQNSPCLIAPELCNLIRRGVRNSRTVAAALSDKRWIQDITGTLTVQALFEYLIL
ncbi:putative ribonuclease H protein [Panicum miliaceum]|uniref:Ribonuclease H protein n=1 Tax=Panicum miliaceum TaxID=4540 RepID=A0A3L6SHH2_PANMI|nr:putative ribonuclease H protein [Panicum miliaceum]